MAPTLNTYEKHQVTERSLIQATWRAVEVETVIQQPALQIGCPGAQGTEDDLSFCFAFLWVI